SIAASVFCTSAALPAFDSASAQPQDPAPADSLCGAGEICLFAPLRRAREVDEGLVWRATLDAILCFPLFDLAFHPAHLQGLGLLGDGLFAAARLVPLALDLERERELERRKQLRLRRERGVHLLLQRLAAARHVAAVDAHVSNAVPGSVELGLDLD